MAGYLAYYETARLSSTDLGGVNFITSNKTFEECVEGMVFDEYS